MARKLRLEFSGACYHVLNRGNYRRNLFADEGAAGAFERCLGEACDRFHWLIHAYVVMVNHFHLALTTPEPNLSDGMKWLQGTWAVRFNRFRREAGRPFQGRYKAFHVEPGHVLGQVVHYIHLNPLRASLVAPERLASYRWSSLHRLILGPRPNWLVARTALANSGGLADTPAGWRSYVSYLGLMATTEPEKRKADFEQLCRGWAIGSVGFRAELREQLRRQPGSVGRFSLLGADSLALSQVRSEQWEETLRAIARAVNIDLQHLPSPKSSAGKVMLAAAMKNLTPVSNAWLAERLSMGGASSVSALVSQFHRRGESGGGEFQEICSRFAT